METQRQIDAYDSAIAYLDEQLGELFNRLNENSLYDNTLIIIVSDHGEAFGEHGLYGHQNSLYRETLHVPLFIRYPAKIRAGTFIEVPVSLRDLTISIASLSDLKGQEKFPGHNITINPNTKSPILAELFQDTSHPPNHPVAHSNLFSLYTEKWYAIFMGGSIELFKSDDLYDHINQVNSQQGQNAIEALKKEMNRLLIGYLSMQ